MDNLKNFDCRAGFKHKNQNEKQQNEKFSAIQQSEVLMFWLILIVAEHTLSKIWKPE